MSRRTGRPLVAEATVTGCQRAFCKEAGDCSNRCEVLLFGIVARASQATIGNRAGLILGKVRRGLRLHKPPAEPSPSGSSRCMQIPSDAACFRPSRNPLNPHLGFGGRALTDPRQTPCCRQISIGTCSFELRRVLPHHAKAAFAVFRVGRLPSQIAASASDGRRNAIRSAKSAARLVHGAAGLLDCPHQPLHSIVRAKQSVHSFARPSALARTRQARIAAAGVGGRLPGHAHPAEK